MEGNADKKRSDAVTIIAAYHLAEAALFLIGLACIAFAAFVILLTAIDTPDIGIPIMALGLAGCVLLLGLAADVAVGWGLLKLQNWARWGALVLSVFRLLGVPIGTIIGGVTIYFLLQDEASALFEAD